MIPEFQNDDESLNFDNQLDQDEEEHAQEGYDDSEAPIESVEEERKGNPAIALKQERERRRKLEQENESMRMEQQRMMMTLQALGNQPQQRQQENPELLRQRLQEDLLDRPDFVLQQNNQAIMQQMMQMNQPLYRSNALNYCASKYADLYNSETFARGFEGYIDEAIARNGYVSNEDIDNAAQFFENMRRDLVGNNNQQEQKTQQPSSRGREKLTSTVNKQSANTKGLTEEQLVHKAISELSPRDYGKWEKDPKNREMLNRVLFPKR